ncbi:MAG: Uma2 family endonuclease [Anaerolineae bacterium]
MATSSPSTVEAAQNTKARRSQREARPLRVDQARLSHLLPPQGEWTADDYLWLTRGTNHLVEWADGWIEVLPMPTDSHQAILGYLFRALFDWLSPQGGIIRFSALKVRLDERRFREPDLLVLLDPHDPRRANDFWLGADLVAEILSPSNADHDLVTKRAEYAQAGIPEYWIVDPDGETLTVLTLDGASYREHGRFVRGDTTTSPLLPGLAVAVDEVFDAP